MLKKYFPYTATRDYTLVKEIAMSFVISWIYALCSQIIVPLPFSLAPLSIQPLPVFFLTLLFNRTAIQGYILYLIQGALGAPFFAFGKSGLSHLFGPTGGFLMGFLVAAYLINFTPEKNSAFNILIKTYIANTVVFICGMTHLINFVPIEGILQHGLLPFLPGDFIIKPILIIVLYFTCTRRNTIRNK